MKKKLRKTYQGTTLKNLFNFGLRSVKVFVSERLLEIDKLVGIVAIHVMGPA